MIVEQQLVPSQLHMLHMNLHDLRTELAWGESEGGHMAGERGPVCGVCYREQDRELTEKEPGIKSLLSQPYFQSCQCAVDSTLCMRVTRSQSHRKQLKHHARWNH